MRGSAAVEYQGHFVYSNGDDMGAHSLDKRKANERYKPNNVKEHNKKMAKAFENFNPLPGGRLKGQFVGKRSEYQSQPLLTLQLIRYP